MQYSVSFMQCMPTRAQRSQRPSNAQGRGDVAAGKLFAAMHAVDADALVKYHFPTERLPTYTQASRLPCGIGLLQRPSGAGSRLTCMNCF